MNVVLFLGAGFSAEFALPVMSSFLGFADVSNRITDDDKAFLGKLVLEARSANSFLQSSPSNLEDILSFAVMGERLQLDNDKSKLTEGKRIKRILQRIYTWYGKPTVFWSRYAALEKFLGFGLGSDLHNVAFVTTNYDINIECACHKLNVYCNPGFPVADDQQAAFYRENGVPVYKLHGSVNWFELDDNSETFHVDARLNDVRIQDVELPLPAVCKTDYTIPSDPVIVPPSFLKPELKSPLHKIWSEAANVLNQANVIVFVGYSFPESDTEMRYFLARALVGNAGLRRIIVVDPLAGEILGRLRNENSKFGTHFQDFLEPIVEKWSKSTLYLG